MSLLCLFDRFMVSPVRLKNESKKDSGISMGFGGNVWVPGHMRPLEKTLNVGTWNRGWSRLVGLWVAA